MTQMLKAEALDLREKIEQAIISGDAFLLNKLRRSQSELTEKQWFLEIQDKKQRLAALIADREAANDLRDQFQDDLRASGKVISGIRQQLEAQEQIHREITARLFYLDTAINGSRKTIAELEREISSAIADKIKEVTQ